MKKALMIPIESRLFCSSNIEQRNQTAPFYFKSKDERLRLSSKFHHETLILNGLSQQEKRQKYKQELQSMIRKWIDYQHNSYEEEHYPQEEEHYPREEEHSPQQEDDRPEYSKLQGNHSVHQKSSPLRRLFNQSNAQNGPLQFSISHFKNYSSQHVKQQIASNIINFLSLNHSLLQKINFSLVETLINIGIFTRYKKGEQIKHMFYSQKTKNQSLENKKLGIILFGQIKLYNKLEAYECKLNQQDTIGEHGIESVGVWFQNYRNINVKTVDQETVVLWIKKEHYEVLFKQSMKCGLKQQIKRLEGFLKINWIKKGVKKFQ